MKNKVLVRQCLESLQNKNIETTMKCRIGIGKKLDYDFFEEFIDEVQNSGVKIIYVHARNAILTGISPSQNRSIPKLDYNFVKKIKLKFPNIIFILNGGITSLDMAKDLLNSFDGVMLGRLIQNNPFLLRKVDDVFFNIKSQDKINEEIILKYFDYIRPKIGKESIFRLLSPILHIFFGVPNSKMFKSKINEYMKNSEIRLIENLLLSFIKNNRIFIN